MTSKFITEEYVASLAQRAYTQGNCDFEFNKEKSALLIIDMQDEFVIPNWTPFWIPESTRQVPKIKKLVQSCRELGVPIIYTVFAKTHFYFDRPKTGSFMPNRYREFDNQDDSWFVEGKIYHELKPLEHEVVIQKPSYGAFFDTPLDTILKNLQKDTVIICGTLTNFCCGMTARQAYERSYKVVFGSDVNSTDDQSLHEAELKVLRKGFAKVISSGEIIKCLQKK